MVIVGYFNGILVVMSCSSGIMLNTQVKGRIEKLQNGINNLLFYML